MDTVEINDVEVLAPGTWNGVTITPQDIEGIVQAYRETADELPPETRLGHDAKQRIATMLFGDDAKLSAFSDGVNGFPALGSPANLRVNERGRLVADFRGMPAKAYQWLKAGAYQGRSVGLRHNKVINGKVYPWWLEHVAWLGDEPPAVPGLAKPVMLAQGEDIAVELGLGVDEAGAQIDLAAVVALTEQQIDDRLTALNERLRAIQDEANTLTKGLPGNPVLNNLFRALREGIDRVVRTNLSGATPMDQDPTPQFADPGAPGAPPVPGADPSGGQAPMTISSPEVLVAMLAAKLGKGPEDYTAIYQATVQLIDAGNAAGDGAGDPTPTPEGTTTMSQIPDPSASAQFSAQLAAQAAELNQTKLQLAQLQIAEQRRAAEAKAGQAIATHALPATVLPILVEFSLQGKDDLFDAVVASAQRVPTGEVGTSASVEFSSVTLTETERHVARANGISEDEFRAQKARDLGIKVPSQSA